MSIEERISSVVVIKDIEQADAYLRKHIDCLILLNYRFSEPLDSIIQTEARLISHIVFSKGLNILKLLEGVTYRSRFVTLNQIIDPLSIAVLVRNIYESVGLFHLLFRAHSGDETELLYLLWKSSGLKYRQLYKKENSSEDTATKLDAEKVEIELIQTSIKENAVYLGMEDEGRKVIDKAIKKKEFQFRFENNHPKFVPWREMIELMGFNDESNSSIYSFLSLYAHPSNVSVFQFDQLFKKDTMEFKGMSGFMINLASWLISAFIADFIFYFPHLLEFFNEQDLENQIIVDFANRLKRDNSYSINESYKSI